MKGSERRARKRGFGREKKGSFMLKVLNFDSLTEFLDSRLRPLNLIFSSLLWSPWNIIIDAMKMIAYEKKNVEICIVIIIDIALRFYLVMYLN